MKLSDGMMRLARAGATQRIAEIDAELQSIFAVFPDLNPGNSNKKTAGAPKSKKVLAARAWSAAARKAVSERMKKYWAARRAKGASK